MGATASGGVRILNDDVITAYSIPEAAIDAVGREEQVELEWREHRYRDGRSPVEFRGHTVLLIDDGLATGASMNAAVSAVRAHEPAHIVVAVPVGSRETCREFAEVADEIVCARAPNILPRSDSPIVTSRRRPTTKSASCFACARSVRPERHERGS